MNLDTASEHVGYINKATAARLLKQAFSCMATCIIICWSPALVMRPSIKSICRDLLFTSKFLASLLVWLRSYIRTMLTTLKGLWPIYEKNVARVLAE